MIVPVNGRHGFYLASLFVMLFVATNFVNKFVLSVLKFTYPTIFQGWQTVVGAIMIKILISAGIMDPITSNLTRSDIALWLPGMMLFVVSIYSGSKALASLSIPVYFAQQNLILVFRQIAVMSINKQITSIFNYIMLMIVVISCVAVIQTDPYFNSEGYFWVCVHLISTGLIEIYTQLINTKLKLSIYERLYSCYIYSVIVLAPSSYFLGDALEAQKFPYLYFTKFYVGCLMSGVFGLCLNLCAIRLQDLQLKVLDLNSLVILSKILGSALSLVIFKTFLTGSHALWLLVNLLCSLAICDPNFDNSSPNIISLGDLPKPKIPGLQLHSMQQDMLKIEIRK
ncbi:hypothetical protein LOTGIDRAFT_237892 [Lottia gigantea]|uniref:Sugar phosphate transporter domain-containing protein n=1 Tax=Lottia gigantea TaxID=225164 RepID=V4B573_LOTGI|nr:hypothetical protein LOTGIDRAFT_237892 [Lottia gigantea]ESP02666.1 hypothetical protein LOTGIDRAFT_237892 [Lottia gigantea]